MAERRYVGPVLLLDNYGESSRMLHESFARAGFDGPVVVINDDGFLPEGVLSVYGALCEDATQPEQGTARYFNQVAVPDYWEISSTNAMGEVADLDKVRARIFYAEPQYKRLVSTVDWLDQSSTVRYSDHYNQRGRLFARTVFSKEGQRFNKTYFSPDGREVLTENYGAHAITLVQEGREFFFQSREDLVLAFFEHEGITATRLFYNSLGTPLFVAGKIPAQNGGHVLFWQENVGDEIPGNMQSIFEEDKWSTTSICVQQRKSFEKLMELGADARIVSPLGFTYGFVKENGGKAQALICTNSDELESITELVEALPEVNFHIAALTEMSAKLMAMGRYPNVSLHPTAKIKIIESLFKRCDIYLDINHYSEIVSAVKQAFLHNHLIFAFDKTLHNETYVAPENIFENHEDMVVAIQEALKAPAKMQGRVWRQRSFALSEDVSAYVAML